jgi:hypothetical protein
MPSMPWATALASSPVTALASVATMMTRPDGSSRFMTGRRTARSPSRSAMVRTPVASITSAPGRRS